MSNEEASPIVAISYAASMIILGASWWRACLVAVAISMVFAIGWGTGWISRGMMILGTVAALVFLQALPPLSEWSGAMKQFRSVSVAKGE